MWFQRKTNRKAWHFLGPARKTDGSISVFAPRASSVSGRGGHGGVLLPRRGRRGGDLRPAARDPIPDAPGVPADCPEGQPGKWPCETEAGLGVAQSCLLPKPSDRQLLLLEGDWECPSQELLISGEFPHVAQMVTSHLDSALSSRWFSGQDHHPAIALPRRSVWTCTH